MWNSEKRKSWVELWKLCNASGPKHALITCKLPKTKSKSKTKTIAKAKAKAKAKTKTKQRQKTAIHGLLVEEYCLKGYMVFSPQKCITLITLTGGNWQK